VTNIFIYSIFSFIHCVTRYFYTPWLRYHLSHIL